MAFGEESRGTQALFCKLNNYFEVLNTGGVLVLDEFDINLHPDILPHLLANLHGQSLQILIAFIFLGSHGPWLLA